MWTTPDQPLALQGVSAAALRALAAAFRNGQLVSPTSSFAVLKVASCPSRLADDLQRLSAEGLSGRHLSMLLTLAADAVEAKMMRETAAELVWSGPESLYAHCRDTLVVLDELFSSAERTVLVSTYVVHQPDRVFATLGARLDAVPSLTAKLFVNIERRIGDTRLESILINEYARVLGDRWPGKRRPGVYFDPRGLSIDDDVRASWHAKCVVVDDAVAFVTSANFTEWAQQRNVEAGALIRSRHFATQLRSQLESLIASQRVTRLAGF
jgi:phosphatidylserine/phosphatidylglycerophosphate/cardiolipin synthase-like enzyme